MNNPTTAMIVAALECRAYDIDCNCDCICFSDFEFNCCSNFEVVRAAANRLTELEQELIDERYRHDRVQDFCVAVCEELRELKEKHHE